MLIERITSRQNPLVKRFRRVRVGGERHLLLLEGVRLVADALEAGVQFESVAFTSGLESNEHGRALLERLQHVPCRGAHVTPQVMEAIADTDSPQGVAALVIRPHFELSDLATDERSIILIADQLQDPGNLGTIIRTADAAGATALITTRQTVDPYNHKALRASMGSALKLPLCAGVRPSDAVSFCRERKLRLIATQAVVRSEETSLADAAVARQVRIYTEVDLTGPVALVLGQEASGVSRDVAADAEVLVHIPMSEGVESLNVAAAASVLLYEAARQRGFEFSGRPHKTRKGPRSATHTRATKH